MKHALLAAVLVACGACSQASPAGAEAPASESTTTLSVGQSAPAFSLSSSNGSSVSLASLTTSGPAVLVFYRGDW